MAGVGEDIKGTGRLDGDAKSNLLQASDHEQASLIVDSLHLGDVLGRLLQSGDAGPLGKRAGADEEVLLHLLNGTDEVLRSDEIAQPESCHGIELGKAVQDKGMVGELQYGMLPAFIDQAVIDLIGDDVRRESGNGPHGVLREKVTGRIGGRVDENGLCLIADSRLDRLRRELEAVLFIDRDPDGNAAQEAYEIGVAGIARVGDDDLLSVLQQRRKDEHHGRRGSGGHDHLIWFYRDAVGAVVMLCDRLSQPQVAQAVRVVGESLSQEPTLSRLLQRLGYRSQARPPPDG